MSISKKKVNTKVLSKRGNTKGSTKENGLERSTKLKTSSSSRNNERASNQSPNPPPVQRNFPNLNLIPMFLHLFIENVVDFKGNGHYGLHVVYGFLGHFFRLIPLLP